MNIQVQGEYATENSKRASIMIKTAVFAVIMTFAGSLQAQVTKAGTTAGQFLKIGVGSRAAAMGESFVALANDVTAVYWNPAGLALVNQNQALFSHIEWIADISHESVAIAMPTGSSLGTVGLWANAISVPEDIVTTVFEPEGTGERFDANMVSLGVSLGKSLTDRFFIGLTGKYIRESIWSMSAGGVGLDVGTLYISQFHNLRVGISLNNFGTKMKLSGRANLLYVDADPTLEGNNDQIRAELEMETWELPLFLRAGIAFDALNNEASRLTLTANSNHPNDNTEYLNFGAEFAIREMLFVRGGYRGLGLDESEGGLSLGGGVHLSATESAGFNLDYAYTDWGRLNNVQRFTISVVF